MSRINCEVDVWVCGWTIDADQIAGASINHLVPGQRLEVDYMEPKRGQFERLSYEPDGERHRFPLENIVTDLVLPYGDAGGPDANIRARIWREGEGLKIALGRSLLAIDFPKGGE